MLTEFDGGVSGEGFDCGFACSVGGSVLSSDPSMTTAEVDNSTRGLGGNPIFCGDTGEVIGSAEIGM